LSGPASFRLVGKSGGNPASFDPEMGFYSAEADIAIFISDMDMLNSFFV
jgi:hypothetical protein